MEIDYCDICSKKTTKKQIKFDGTLKRCRPCQTKKKKEEREDKAIQLGIIKPKKPKSKPKDSPPTPKGAKQRSHSRKLHNYITKNEKQFLWSKYKSFGFSNRKANQKINNISTQMKEFVKKLKKQRKSKKEIDQQFKEEFAKLISQ